MKRILSIAALSLMLGACSANLTPEPNYAFDHEGTLVQNEPGLTPAAWYLRYDDGTNTGMTMRIVLDENSQCVVGDERGACERSLFQQGLNVRVGGTPENGMVTAGVVQVLGQ